MLDELDKLIMFIQEKYNQLLNEWNNIKEYSDFNLKKIEVREIVNNNQILNQIFDYRLFINENNLELCQEMKGLNLNSFIDARVKLKNSIEDKIDNYIKNHEEGKVSVNKCINDIYGVRIIFNENIKYDDIKKYIEIKNKESTLDLKLKCTDATKPKENYVATHIYFKKDNYSFPWELQVWDKKHQQSNIKAHEKYKQKYTKWEKEIYKEDYKKLEKNNKGGEYNW